MYKTFFIQIKKSSEFYLSSKLEKFREKKNFKGKKWEKVPGKLEIEF